MPTPRTFKGKDGKPDRTVYEQKAFAHLGGVFPVQFTLTHDDHKNAYEIGEYQLAPESFKIGPYGDLQIDRYNLKLKPIKS